jgi:hypothetical protein
MAAINGVFSTSGLPLDLAQKSFSSMITRLMPNGNAPLFALTSMMKSEVAVQFEHGYYSKTMVFPSVVLNVAVATGAVTQLTAVSTIGILPGMVLQSDLTKENVRVISVDSGTLFTVQRGFGTIPAAAITTGTAMWMIGSAFEESSLRPQALSIQAVRNNNLTQIFRNTWAVSGSLRNTSMIAGDSQVAENKTDCAAFHAADIEKALFFSQKSQNIVNGQPIRGMEGLVANTTLNAPGNITLNAGATTNFTNFELMVDPVFNQITDPTSSPERIMFVGPTTHRAINQIGRLNGTYYMLDGQTNFGLQFKTIKLSRGTLRIVEHPLLGAFGSASSLAKMAIICDLPTFAVAYLGDRKTEHLAFNSQVDRAEGTASDNGIDATGGTLTTECTALFKNPQANAIIYGLTQGAVG